MAHRRKKHTRHHGRRRRPRGVGALKLGSKDIGLKLAAIAGGWFLGGVVNTAVDKVLPKTTDPVPVPTKNAQIAATAGEIGIGGLLLLRRSSGTSGMVQKVAGGILVGAGLKRALKVMGVISGYQNVPVIGRHRMAGYQNVPVIGGTPPQLAGKTPAQLQGFRVNGYNAAGSGVGAYIPSGSGVMGSIGNCEGGSGITNTGSGYMN